MNLIDEIKGIIAGLNPGVDVDVDEDLFDNGLLDSFKIFNELIPKLEERYKVEISPLDLMPENFMSISALAKFLETKSS